MTPTERLYSGGQSLWLDNITRDLLTSGTLARYVRELSVKGLTSNPTIFDQAMKTGTQSALRCPQLMLIATGGGLELAVRAHEPLDYRERVVPHAVIGVARSLLAEG